MTDPEGSAAGGTLGSAALYCENCRKETLHRLLHVERGLGPHAPKAVGGIARCRECRWTHPFVSARPSVASFDLVVSAGPTSERRQVELSPSALLVRGEPVPGLDGRFTVSKIEGKAGRTVAQALVRDVRTVWAVDDRARVVRVAVLEGAFSRTERLPVTDGLRLTVGQTVRLPSGPVTIVGLRAQERTWREPGDTFPAGEVKVVYGRRTVTPPAGRSDWRRERGTPRARASSVSVDGRSRSSPGVRTKRTVPRAAIAAAGATERNSPRS